MRTLVLEKRQDHDTSLSFAAAFGGAVLLASLTALPWPAALAQAPCTAIENDAERLVCYDRALRGAAPPAATPSAAAAPTAAAPASSAAPAAPVAGSSSSDQPQTVPLVIVDWRALPGREANFTAQDGSIWVQTDSQRLTGMPDAPFDAELKRGAMGSYFLVPKDHGRAIRVRAAR